MRWDPIWAFCIVAVSLSGCLQPFDDYHEFDVDDPYTNPGVFPGEYHMGNGGSNPMVAGSLNATLPEVIRLKSNLPAYGAASGVMGNDSDVDIVMAVWKPWNVTEPLPVIVDAGPYYEVWAHCAVPRQDPCLQWIDDTIDYPGQRTPWLLSSMLPHGYIVVQLAVRGTGTAGGCMDLLGPSEAHDLDQAITWLGEQNWTNGNIAMIGASYDGSTPWEVAGLGNPYLKTIVPVSGLPDIYDLMFHNGSAEFRGSFMHSDVYWGFGFDDDFPQRPPQLPPEAPWLDPIGNGQANGRNQSQDMQNLLCPEAHEGRVMGQYTTANGDRGAAFTQYWVERDYRQRVIDNYEGSVFLIHGLQDWNVDPHAAIPFNQQLRDAGIPMKEWYGQWGHAFPDSTCANTVPDWGVLPCRLDFGDILLRWFNHYLKGNMTVPLGPEIQVQDNLGFWRNADSYPARDADWQPVTLGFDGALGGKAAGDVRLMPPGNSGPGQLLEFRSEPLDADLHLSGLPQVKIPFTPEGQGGQIAVWLFDEDERGLVRAPNLGMHPISREWMAYGTPVIGHAQLNLRYYAGGDEPQPLVPGVRHVAQVEFEPLEVRVPAGHRLVMWVFQYHFDDRIDSSTPSPVTLHLGPDAKFMMPVMDVDPRTVFPVPGAHFLNHTYVPEMYIHYPRVPAPYSTPQLPVTPVAAPTEPAPVASAPQPSGKASCVVCL